MKCGSKLLFRHRSNTSLNEGLEPWDLFARPELTHWIQVQ